MLFPPGKLTGAPRERLLLAAASCVLVSLPFVAVKFPPVTDLPQHAAQVRLFLEAVGHPESPYTIQWATPYGLVYMVLGAAWSLFGADDAGRVGLLVIGWLSVCATHWLAAARQRPPATATLASALFFNHVVYWGFYSFALGWPVFILWFLLTSRAGPPAFRWIDLLLFPGCALLLYLTHALWFAAALVWLVMSGLVLRAPGRVLLVRLALVAPVALAATLTYRQLAERLPPFPTIWGPRGFARLSPAWLVDAALGGVRGLLEPTLLSLIAAWLLVALWQAGRQWWSRADRGCLLAAGVLFALVLLLPHKYQNTIRFAERWMPFAAVLALVAMPPVRLTPLVQRAVSVAALAVFCSATLTVWVAFERTGLTGLRAALEALPRSQRVIGLAFVRSSPLLKPLPFVQTFAYAQVWKGGTLNFSFAEFPHTFVAYKAPREFGWTPNLEWFPWLAEPADFPHFDYAILGASEGIHALVPRRFPLAPVTTNGTWRLYRVRPSTSEPSAENAGPGDRPEPDSPGPVPSSDG